MATGTAGGELSHKALLFCLKLPQISSLGPPRMLWALIGCWRFPRALADPGTALPAARRQGWLLCQAAFIPVGCCYPPKCASREILLVRSLCPTLGVLRHVRGVVPGLKGPEAKGKVKRGRLMQGGGWAEGWAAGSRAGCGRATGTFTWRKALVSGSSGD